MLTKRESCNTFFFISKSVYINTALLREGIEVSPATCARIMASNRQLYGMPKPPHSPRPKLPRDAQRACGRANR